MDDKTLRIVDDSVDLEEVEKMLDAMSKEEREEYLKKYER